MNFYLIADTLSRAYLLNEPASEKNNCDVFAVRQEEFNQVHGRN